MSASVSEPTYNLSDTSGDSYRWDATGEQYIYNWNTKGTFISGRLYKISVELDDGNTYFVTVGLK